MYRQLSRSCWYFPLSFPSPPSLMSRFSSQLLVSFVHFCFFYVCFSSYVFLSLAHYCLIYLILCIFFKPVHYSSSSNFPCANFPFLPCLRSMMVPSPHSIVIYFLCTRPCFLLQSKFRPEQDITKTYAKPNMMSWPRRVCFRVCVISQTILMCIDCMYFYVDANKQSGADVSLLITNYR